MSMEERIARCWQHALSILQPSAAELERGLRLHQEALVWDAYSFVPTRAWNGAAYDQCVEEGASRNEIKDRMEMQSQITYLQDPEMRRQYALAWQKAGVDCVFLNCGEESNTVETLIKRLARYSHVTELYPEMVRRCVFPGQVTAAREAGIPAIYPSANGVPLPARLESGEEALAFLEIFFQLGMRMMHMTYNRRNLLGDGCAEPGDAGLSDLGVAVVQEMNRVGIIPDVAHSGQKTSLMTARCSSRPVVASHSFARALSSHFRGKEDEVITAICDSGGYIGVCCIPGFLEGSGKIDAFLDHLAYLIRKFGAGHVAIGTDCGANCGETIPNQHSGKARRIFESYWPRPYGISATEEMRETMAWTNWPLFSVGLVQRGFSETEIRQVLGENVLRVTRATLEGLPAGGRS